MSLAGKVVLVTGGSKGIGKATALKAAAQGATVAINYGSDTAAADETVKQIGADKCFAVQANVGKVAEIEKLVDAIVTKYGRIDVLIANAATAPMKDLESTTEADFDNAYSINVKGPYFLVQKAAPHIPSGGRVILVSTSLATASHITPNYLLYVSTKGAIEQMVRVLSKTLAPKGITVNAIAPGPTATELFYKGKPQAVIDHIAGLSPFNRIGEPAQVADGFLFLAGEAASWVSGQILRVNGAMS